MAIVTVDSLLKARKLAKRRKFQGLDISIETAKGSYRHWYDPHVGKAGKTKMPHDYGYIRGSMGADGDHVDCYVGPNESAERAYVINQMKAPDFTRFDEQKVMLGFSSATEAKAAYLSCYNNTRFFGSMRAVAMQDFKKQVLATTHSSPLVMSMQHHDQRQHNGDGQVDTLHAPMVTTRPRFVLQKAGPFIGPKGGKWADAKHTIPWTVDVRSHHTQLRGETAVFRYHVKDVGGGKVRISRHEDRKYGPTMPVASLKHFVNDLEGKVDLPRHPHHAGINAVIDGKATMLGKGDDGVAFKVGDQVVKMSTTVPYQPENPGHRSPENAADMLRAQVDIGNKLAMTIPGIQHSEFERHGDKGFQIKEYVEIPDKFSRAQLDSAQDTLIAMHEHGYSLNDEVQVGVNSKGDVVMFDVGKASSLDADDASKGIYSAAQGDMDNMKRMYQEHGHDFVRRDHDEGEVAWERVQDRIMKWSANPKLRKLGARHVKSAAELRRKIARITLSGDKLDRRIEAIDGDEVGASWELDVDLDDTKKSASPDRLLKGGGHAYVSKRMVGGKWVYSYGVPLRPIGFATVPKGYIHASDPHPKVPAMRHGVVSYAKPLSADAVKNYSLVHIPGNDSGLVKHIAAKLGEYAEAFVEDYDDDPSFASMPVGAHLDDLEVPVHADRDDITAKVIAHLRGGLSKAEQFPRLYVLRKAGAPAGFGPIPNGTRGGYRKKVSGKWAYWYPSAEGPGKATEYSEADFAAGKFDKTPGHWHFIRAGAGRSEIHAWTVGGVDPDSNHPVKIAGREALLYQIVNPEHEKGWAQLRNVNSGETVIIKHDRVYPVEHGRNAKRKPQPKGGMVDVEKPKGGAPTGWVMGSDIRIQPYADSTAKKGTMLHRVERGFYPRKKRRVWREDADGVPRKHEDEVLHMREGDKVLLLGEMQGLVRKAADSARRKLGIQKSAEVVEDMRAAAMEGLLHAIDNYRGGYSFSKSAMSYADQHARLHAAREFAGGFGMTKREARLMPGFMAARSEANRLVGGEASAQDIARMWKLRKRDRHEGLEEGKNDPIPMGRYNLKSGAIVSGNDKPGKIELAQNYAEFLDGQRKGGIGLEEDGPLLPGAGTGIGMGASERMETQHALTEALGGVEKLEVVIDRRIYRLNGADLVTRRLGLGMDPQSTTKIAEEVPIYRIARGGDLKQLSPRAAKDIIAQATQEALSHMRGELTGPVAALVQRAATNLAPRPEVGRGGRYSMKEKIEAGSRSVTSDDVKAWRAKERKRLRVLESSMREQGDPDRADAARAAHQRIASIGTKEARRHIAEMRLINRPASREWFRNAIATPIDFEDPRNTYGAATITMTDLGTGKQRQVRIRTVRDFTNSEDAYKSDTGGGTVPDMVTIRMVALFPRLSHALWGSDDAMAFAPTSGRAQVLEAMGLWW